MLQPVHGGIVAVTTCHVVTEIHELSQDVTSLSLLVIPKKFSLGCTPRYSCKRAGHSINRGLEVALAEMVIDQGIQCSAKHYIFVNVIDVALQTQRTKKRLRLVTPSNLP